MSLLATMLAASAAPQGPSTAESDATLTYTAEAPAEVMAISATEVVIYDLEGATGDWFGYSVGIDGDLIVVGAPKDDSVQAADRGSVSVFELRPDGIYQGKTQATELDDRAATSRWWTGYDVAINGTSTAIGAPLRPVIIVTGQNPATWDLKPRGMVINIQWDGTHVVSSSFDHGFYWTEHYGYAVSLGGYAVGAPFASVFCDDISNCPPGEEWADVLGRVDVGTSDWLFPHDPQDDLRFGTDVAHNGGLLAAVARGSVYAFSDAGGWHEVQEISGFDVDETLVVALEDGYLAIGRPAGVNPQGTATGVVMVYRWTGSTFELDETLWPTDGASGDLFGRSVAMDGTNLVVGATLHGTGAAYVLERNDSTWTGRYKLVRAAGSETDGFGAAVDLSGDRVVVGAPLHDDNGQDSGAVYLFDLAASPPPPAPTCDGVEATITGTDGNDELTGTAGDDVVAGLGGDDTIWGLEGDDLICGGPGNDVMYGGDGADLIRGSTGDDESHGDAGGDRIQDGPGNDYLSGGPGKDKLWGGIGVDTLYGGDGNDQLHGNRDNDVLHGDAGTDRLWGDAGNDTLYGDANSDFLYGGIDVDTLWGGDGNDRLFGWIGDDFLYGQDGKDQLRGQAGDDVNDGGRHHDWCSLETIWLNCEKAL